MYFIDDPDVDRELAMHQMIHHYEVAAGSDRRYPSTRQNIHPFIDVGLSRAWTFSDLQLVSKEATYYITVRAYSLNRAMVEVTSSGVKAGYSGVLISLGQIEIPE